MSSYYISRKSFSVWISMLFAVVSLFAGARFLTDAMSTGISVYKTAGIAALPVSAVTFIICVCIFGRKRFAFTIFPVIIGCISLMIVSVGRSLGSVILCRVLCVATCILYISVIFNKIKTNTLLVYLFGLTVINSIIVIYLNREEIGLQDISAFAAVMSMFCISLGMRREYDGHILKWNDRASGRRVRTMPPMSKITPYFMPGRIGAQNLIREEVELSEIEKYILKKRKEGLKGFGFMHIFITTYLRVVAKYPGLNRFLSGQKIYSRFNCIVAFVVKKEMNIKAPDTVVKVEFTPGISADEVYKGISAVVSENKGETDDSTFDSVAKYLNYIPGVFLKLTVWFLKVLDYFGLLPTALEQVSPFHGSMFFTSVASLGIPAIFHHLYNFGNVPVFCAFGKKYKKNELDYDGTVITRKYIDYTFSVDERICDGFYFSLVLREFKRILSSPECLDESILPQKDVK